jgi:hypothetical protein
MGVRCTHDARLKHPTELQISHKLGLTNHFLKAIYAWL